MNVSAADINQFASFVQFADAVGSGSRTVARLSDELPGPSGAKLIAVNTTDKSFAFTRSAENKASNNDVRALFRQTVANLFGGDEKNIPQSVRKEMKFGDYNKGRPLTAKRIKAVEIAIDNYFLNEDRMYVNGNKVSITALSRGIDVAGTTSNADNIVNTGFSINDAGDEDNNIINTNTIKEAPKPQGNTQTQQTVKKGGIYDNPAFKAMNGKMMHNLPVGGTPQDVQKALNPNSGTNIVVEHKSEDEILDMKPTQQDKKPKAKKPKFFTEN